GRLAVRDDDHEVLLAVVLHRVRSPVLRVRRVASVVPAVVRAIGVEGELRAVASGREVAALATHEVGVELEQRLSERRPAVALERLDGALEVLEMRAREA